MVRFLLGGARRSRLRLVSVVVGAALIAPGLAPGRIKKKTTEVRIPELLLEGGRKLTFDRSISSERDVKPKRGFFTKVFDIVLGEPDFHFLVRPYSGRAGCPHL
jgi:hypothetical protein